MIQRYLAIRRMPSSQAPQEIQQVLFLGVPKRAEPPGHGVGFRRREVGIASTRVRLDRLDEVGGSAVVQQEDPLPEPAQGCRPELVWPCDALDNVVGQPGSHSMQEQIGEQSGRFLAERRARGSTRGQRRRVAQGAADLAEHAAAASAGRRLGSRLRRRQEAHEELELRHVADGISRRRRVELRVIFGCPIEQTRGRFVAFRLEELVRHALFDVVRLTRKDHEGLVLRLPAEPRDAAVIAARVGPARSMSIWSSTNSLAARLERAVAKLAMIVASAISSIRPAPNTGGGMRKIRLLRAAARLKSGWASTVGLEFEPRLADWPVEADEGRNDILRAGLRRNRDLRIDGRTGASRCRLRVASAAAIEVEPRAEAVLHGFNFPEGREASLKERKL